MPRSVLPALLLAMTLPLGGCLAKTALDVATLPVRAGSGAVDAVTTSQSEADEKRGRDMRRREERLGKLRRDYDKQRRQCDRGDADACDRARALYAQMQEIMPTAPYEPAR